MTQSSRTFGFSLVPPSLQLPLTSARGAGAGRAGRDLKVEHNALPDKVFSCLSDQLRQARQTQLCIIKGNWKPLVQAWQTRENTK